jgi:YgiT-type zinc finger domain-containing protein
MKETFVDTKVTYTLELEGKLYVIENVPARVCRETGEQLFSPGTVGCLQRTIWEKKKPKRVIETPVYEYGQLADPR